MRCESNSHPWTDWQIFPVCAQYLVSVSILECGLTFNVCDMVRRSILVGSGPALFCCMGGLVYCLIAWALLSWRCKDLHVS